MSSSKAEWMSHNLKKTVKWAALIVSSASQYRFISSPLVYALEVKSIIFHYLREMKRDVNDEEENNFSHKTSHFTYRFFIFFAFHSMTVVAENGSTWKLTNRNLSESWGRKEASEKCRWKLQKNCHHAKKFLFYWTFFLTHSIDSMLTSTISS